MAPLSFIANRLARTRFGQRALTQPELITILKQKPTTRVYVGLALMALSYLIGLPGLAFLGYLSIRFSKPLIVGFGGPVLFGLVHVMFALGAYLAGKNFAGAAVLWATRWFLKRFACPPFE